MKNDQRFEKLKEILGEKKSSILETIPLMNTSCTIENVNIFLVLESPNKKTVAR